MQPKGFLIVATDEDKNLTATETAASSSIAPLVAKSHEVAQVLKLLSNQKRLLILCKLAEASECSVTALGEAVDLGQSALSQHLARLRAQGLVGFRRQSQTIHYFIADAQLERLLTALKQIYCPDI